VHSSQATGGLVWTPCCFILEWNVPFQLESRSLWLIYLLHPRDIKIAITAHTFAAHSTTTFNGLIISTLKQKEIWWNIRILHDNLEPFIAEPDLFNKNKMLPLVCSSYTPSSKIILTLIPPNSFSTGALHGIRCQLQAPGASPPGKDLPDPLHGRLGSTQSRPGCFEEKNVLPLPAVEPQFHVSSDRPLVLRRLRYPVTPCSQAAEN
jgi:hypothetical protein